MLCLSPSLHLISHLPYRQAFSSLSINFFQTPVSVFKRIEKAQHDSSASHFALSEWRVHLIISAQM